MKYSIKDFLIQVVIVVAVSAGSLFLLSGRYLEKCETRILSGQIKEVYAPITPSIFASIKATANLTTPLSEEEMQTQFQQPMMLIYEVLQSKDFSSYDLIHKGQETGLITVKYPIDRSGNEGYVFVSKDLKIGDYVDYCQSVKVAKKDKFPEDSLAAKLNQAPVAK